MRLRLRNGCHQDPGQSAGAQLFFQLRGSRLAWRWRFLGTTIRAAALVIGWQATTLVLRPAAVAGAVVALLAWTAHSGHAISGATVARTAVTQAANRIFSRATPAFELIRSPGS